MKFKNKIHKYYKGSSTIEMALLFPMILTIIVIIIYFSFYFHDRAVLSASAYSAALRGSLVYENFDVTEYVEKCAKELISNRLLATTDITDSVSISGDTISVCYSGILKIPAGSLLCKYLTGGSESINVTASGNAKINNPVKFIRECRFIENALK